MHVTVTRVRDSNGRLERSTRKSNGRMDRSARNEKQHDLHPLTYLIKTVYLDQDKIVRRTIVNMVVKFGFHLDVGFRYSDDINYY